MSCVTFISNGAPYQQVVECVHGWDVLSSDAGLLFGTRIYTGLILECLVAGARGPCPTLTTIFTFLLALHVQSSTLTLLNVFVKANVQGFPLMTSVLSPSRSKEASIVGTPINIDMAFASNLFTA